MNLRSSALALILLIAFDQVDVLASEDSYIRMISELPAEDDLTVDSATILLHCTRVLDNRKTAAANDVRDALSHRAFAYLQRGNYLAAKADLDDLCVLEPSNALARAHLARAHVGLKRLDDAALEAENAVRLAPKNPNVYLSVAAVLQARGELTASLAPLEKALSLNPRLAPAYFGRALIHAQKNEPERALADLDKLLSLAPYSSVAPHTPYAVRGFCLVLLNRPSEALSSLLMAQKLKPESSLVSLNLAQAYLDLQRFRLATRHAKECVRLDPSSIAGFALVAKSATRLGDAKEAHKAVAQMMDLFDAKPAYWHIVADVHVEIGEYGKAMEYYNRGLAAEGQSPLLLAGKAALLASCPDGRVRNGPLALKLAEKAYHSAAVGEHDRWIYAMALAEACADNGNFDEAVRYVLIALQKAGEEFGRKEEFRSKLSLFRKQIPFRLKSGSSGNRACSP